MLNDEIASQCLTCLNWKKETGEWGKCDVIVRYVKPGHCDFVQKYMFSLPNFSCKFWIKKETIQE